MQLMQKYEADIDYCPQCKGVWLDRGEIDKIANIQCRYEDSHYRKYHCGNIHYDEDDEHINKYRTKGSRFLDDLFDF